MGHEDIQSREDVFEQASVLQTGRWYIAELDDPPIAMQGESREEALDKLAKRWEKYTDDPGHDWVEMPTDPRRGEL